MAYDKTKFQKSRTIPNVPNEPKPNGYNNPSELMATIKGGGYFTDHFGFTQGLVLVNDTIVAIASDGYNLGTITAVAPVAITWLF